MTSSGNRVLKSWSALLLLATVVGMAPARTALAELRPIVELPKPTDDSPLELGTLPVAERFTIEIKILNGTQQNITSASGYRCNREGEIWKIVSERSPSSPIALLVFDGDRLVFRWESGANKSLTGGLRNCLLQVTHGEKPPEKTAENAVQQTTPKIKVITLRKPIVGTANILELERDTDTFNPEVDDLPANDNLTLEVFGLSGYEGPLTFKPENKRATLKQPVSIVLKAVPPMNQQGGAPLNVTPGMELNVMLTKLGPSLLLEVRPLVIAGTGTTTHSLTLKVLTAEVNRTRTQLSSAKFKLAADEKLLAQLEQKLVLMNQPGNRTAKQKNAFEASVSKVQGQLNNDKQKIDMLRKQVALLQGQQDTLPELLKIATDLHDHAAVEFRVLYAIDRHFIVLFATEKAPLDPPVSMY
jgi:hypothetical protein